MTQVKCKQTNEVFSVKVSINTEYQEIVNYMLDAVNKYSSLPEDKQ